MSADCEKCGGAGFYNGPSGHGHEMYCPDCLRKGEVNEAARKYAVRHEIPRSKRGNSDVYGLPELMEQDF